MSKALAKRDAAEPAKQRTDAWGLDGLNDKQRAEADAMKAEIETRPMRPSATASYDKKGKLTLTLGDPDTKGDDVLNSIRAFEAFGSSSNAFVGDMLSRIINLVPLAKDGSIDGPRISGALALIAAIDPQNELEATMALQMVAANEHTLLCFNRSRKAEYMHHAAPYSNMANKAMRSFALHAEAIAKLRRGGEQVVKHVHVNEGGQAVIAQTVNTGGRG